MGNGFARLPPGGSPISVSALRALLGENQPERSLRKALSDRFPGTTATLHTSGREALRVAFARLATSTARNEIAIPAYSCFSIPAAAVAAGLRVRLVDIDVTGQLDLESLASLPLGHLAAITVANLFGVPEPIEAAIGLARAAGVGVVDDAAQTLGGASFDGPVGSRGDVGVLSFGRGKPLSALGGGALIWRQPSLSDAVPDEAENPNRWEALLRAVTYDAARIPVLLRALSAIPALGIGTTIYDTSFSQGPIPGAAVALAAALLPELDAANQSRSRRAEAIGARLSVETNFVPLLARPDDTGVYPRLGVLAPTPLQCRAALAALEPLGATRMYPTPLSEIPALLPHLVGDVHCPGAQDFCARLLTLPTHAALRGRRLDEVVRILQRV